MLEGSWMLESWILES
jgi:hypothetical protein